MQRLLRPTDIQPSSARRALLTAGVAWLATGRLAVAQDAAPRPRLDVPYVPTPQDVVDAMLKMGQVKKGDVLYDLGCGDGRIVISAAKQYGARGLGIDIDPVRIQEARENAAKAGVAQRVQFLQGDLFQADFSPATVVTLYLLPDINLKLRPQLWRQLRVGTRVVSHAFNMGEDWPPEQTRRVATSTLYAWTIKPEHKKA